MNLYGNLLDEAAMAGMLYGMNPKTIVSIPASETINFGKAVFLNAEKTALVGGKYNNKAVIDLSATIMCLENKMPMLIFGLNEDNSIVNSVIGEFNGTRVTV